MLSASKGRRLQSLSIPTLLAAAGAGAGSRSSSRPLVTAPLTRGQMAVFLSKAPGLHFPD